MPNSFKYIMSAWFFGLVVFVIGAIGSIRTFEVIATVPGKQAAGYHLNRFTGEVTYWDCTGIGKAGGCMVNLLRYE
jgi:hypothetical protein